MYTQPPRYGSLARRIRAAFVAHRICGCENVALKTAVAAVGGGSGGGGGGGGGEKEEEQEEEEENEVEEEDGSSREQEGSSRQNQRELGKEEALSFGGRRSLRTISSRNALFCSQKRGREKEKEIQRRRGSRTKRTRETDSVIMLYVEVVASRDRGSRR
ncbi:hypothetical protein P5V15_008959 [Pogonomyrmex californicus]